MYNNRFKDLFLQNSLDYPDCTLSWEGISLTFVQIPNLLISLEDHLKTITGSADACYLLPVKNTIEDAILIIYLLSSDNSFLLISEDEYTEKKEHNISGFCEYIISPTESLSPDTIDHWISNVEVKKNPHYSQSGIVKDKVIFKTSGTTNKPKYVGHSKETIYLNCQNFSRQSTIVSSDRVLIPVPIYHMYGFGAALIPVLIAGASVSLVDKTNVLRLMEAERRFLPNVLFLTPLLCHMLINAKKGRTGYKLTVAAGDLIKPEIFENYESRFGTLINLYGSTELGVIAISNLNDDLNTRSSGYIRCLPDVIIEPDESDLKSSNDIVPLLCTHKYRFQSYIDDKGQVLASGGETEPFKTSDLGVLDIPDRFKVIGRTGTSIKRNGFLIPFSIIESSIEKHCVSVKQAVVVPEEDDRNVIGKKIIAICTVFEDISLEDIRKNCQDNLKRYMVPDEVIIVPEHPKTKSGKIDRKTLVEQIMSKRIKTQKI